MMKVTFAVQSATTVGDTSSSTIADPAVVPGTAMPAASLRDISSVALPLSDGLWCPANTSTAVILPAAPSSRQTRVTLYAIRMRMKVVRCAAPLSSTVIACARLLVKNRRCAIGASWRSVQSLSTVAVAPISHRTSRPER